MKTHILCSIVFSLENPVVYEIRWKNITEPHRAQVTIWDMRISCWTPKATNTVSEYVILSPFPLQQWLQERTTLLRCMYTACLVQYCDSYFVNTRGYVYICAKRRLAIRIFTPDITALKTRTWQNPTVIELQHD